MAECIKKDELLKFKADVYDEDGHLLYAVPTGYIVAMPPADVMPVRHGRWINYGTGYNWCYECSVCGWKDGYLFEDRHNYCPNCGAKMDGERKENEDG